MIVVVQHQCEDYDAWRPVFEEHGAVRREHGCTSERVYRAADDPNSIAIVIECSSQGEGERFMANPSLGEAMSRGGVIGAPSVTFGERVGVPTP